MSKKLDQNINITSNILRPLFLILSILILISLFILFGITPLRILSQQNNLEKKALEIRQKIEQNTFFGTAQVLKALQENKTIIKSLETDETNNALIVNQLAKDVLDASIVYLMDTNGVVISSTEYISAKGQVMSLTGNNYAFRPYFQDALAGNIVIYPAEGITTGERGIYCSAPVYNTLNTKIIGVIVIKLDISKIEAEFTAYSQIILLLSPDNIVFATNCKKFLYAVPESKYLSIKAHIGKTRQFEVKKLVPLPFELNKSEIFFDDTTYITELQAISKSNWSILIYEERNPNHKIDKSFIKLILGITLIFIVLSGIILSLLYIMRKRNKAEHELKQNRERLRTTLNSIGEAVISVDIKGKIIQSNPVALRLLNLDTNKLEGAHISEVFKLIDPTSKKEDREIINAINNKKGNISKELILRNNQQKDYEISVLINPLIDNKNNFLGMVIVFRDITLEKETKLKLKTRNKQIVEALEKAEESDRLKTAFLQNINHEIRTPLNGIVGFSELLSATDLDPEIIDEYRQHIIQNANYLLDIIQNVIEISKLETNQIKLNTIRFDLNQTCNELFQRYHSIYSENKKIELVLSIINPLEPNFITNDLEKITKIFNILLENAFKFTNSGKITFGYKTSDNKAICFVEDTGIGIPEEFQENVFKHFIKISDDNKKMPRGIGVGLSIAQQYAIILGGSIWLESTKDKGSTFYFTIPLLD